MYFFWDLRFHSYKQSPPLRYDRGQQYQFIGINTEGKTLWLELQSMVSGALAETLRVAG
jgi:hypothetical protein